MTQKGFALTPRPAAARDKRDKPCMCKVNSEEPCRQPTDAANSRHDTRARVACDGGREGAKAANLFHLDLNSSGSIRHAAGVACG